MSQTSIEVFYSFQSPYSYLALEGIYDLEAKFDIEFIWQPFSAKAAGQQVTPMPVIADKLTYLIEDTERHAADMGIPLKFPEGWPENEFDPGRMTRAAIAALDMGVLKEFNFKVFDKIWGEGENPNDEAFTTSLCEDLDVDLGEFLSKLSSSDTRERIKGIYKRGKKLGVYDTPTFVIDNQERIFGLERLPYLAERLTKMGLKKK
jgi:2-hydroxychromene-2-carboxylate isomerase